MKRLLLAGCLLASTHAMAQKDYCKDIVTEVKELSGRKTYSTPVSFNQPNVSISRDITPKGAITGVSFLAKAYNSFIGSKGLYIKFEDGTVLKYPEQRITSDYGSGYYYGATTVNPTDEELKIFTTQKIVKYQIGEIEVPFPSKWQDRYLGWAQCIASKE